jgi:TonB family protein
MRIICLIFGLIIFSIQAVAFNNRHTSHMDSIKKKPLELRKIDKPIMLDDKIDDVLLEPIPEKGNSTKRTAKQVSKENKESTKDSKEETECEKTSLGIPENCNMAKFPGGEKAIREFVRKNKQYPKECKARRIKGTVKISMTISPDGTPGLPSITKSSGNDLLDAEAMRIASLMPQWEPAKDIENGEERIYQMKITFRPGR